MRIVFSHFIYFQGIIHATNVWLPSIYASKLLLKPIWVNFSRERFMDAESFHYFCQTNSITYNRCKRFLQNRPKP